MDSFYSSVIVVTYDTFDQLIILRLSIRSLTYATLPHIFSYGSPKFLSGVYVS